MSVLIFVQRQEYRWQLHCCCFYCFPNLSKFGAAEKTKTTVQLSWMWLLIILATYSSPNKIIVVDTPHPFLMAFWKYSMSGRKGRQAGGYSTPSQIYEHCTRSPRSGVKKRNTRVLVLVLRSIPLQHLKGKSTPMTQAQLPEHKGTEISLCLRDDNKERCSRSKLQHLTALLQSDMGKNFELVAHMFVKHIQKVPARELLKSWQFEVMWSSFVSVFVLLIKCLKLKRLTFCWLNLMNVLTVHIFPDYLIFTFFSYLCDIVDLLTSNLAVWFVTIRQHKLLLWTTDFNYGCFGSTFINSQIKVNI